MSSNSNIFTLQEAGDVLYLFCQNVVLGLLFKKELLYFVYVIRKLIGLNYLINKWCILSEKVNERLPA